MSKLHVATSRCPEAESKSKQSDIETINQLKSEIQKLKNNSADLRKDKEVSISTWKQHWKQEEQQSQQLEKELQFAKGKMSRIEADLHRMNGQQKHLERQLRARNEQVTESLGM